MSACSELIRPRVILVVDDNPLERYMTRQALSQAGFVVHEHENGLDASQAFPALEPDLVVMDVKMPRMDGFTACSIIRRHPAGEHVPILMMTGLDDVESINRAYEVGASDFITKPLNAPILVHRVRYMLRAQQTAQELRESEWLLAHAQRLAKLGSWQWYLDSRRLTRSVEAARIIGAPEHDEGDPLPVLLDRVHPDDRDDVRSQYLNVVRNAEPRSLDYRVLGPEGDDRIVHEELAVGVDADGRVVRLFGTVQDISESRRTEERIRHLAYYDSVTGLPNRTLLKEHVRQVLAIALRHGRSAALLFLDLDHFKRINDTLGHNTGDELLRMVAHENGIGRNWSRRDFVKRATGATLLAATGASVASRPVKAKSKTLKILQWNHFVPAYDQWFSNEYIPAWGERYDTEVIIDQVGMTSLKGRADAEVATQSGHDLFMFLSPPPSYEQHVIDHREVYEECERRYGRPIDLAVKSTFNPKTGRYYGFSDSYVPDPVNYRKDLWDDVGVEPDTWEHIREGGREIWHRHKIPMGLGLAPELDSNMALRSILHAFGASVQNESARPALDSPEALEAIKFVKAMYEESMTDEVFTWDPSSNNRLLLAGRGSLALNAISITRTGEDKKIPVAERIWLAPAAAGPARRIGLQHLLDVYVIWKFAENIEGAKQFLVDYVGEFRKAFLASRFYNFPCFPDTVPDLEALIADDPAANPRNKYQVFEDVSSWITNVGFPGHANAAIDELFNSWTISTMFAEAARGNMRPADALKAAHGEAEHTFAKWREQGLV